MKYAVKWLYPSGKPLYLMPDNEEFVELDWSADIEKAKLFRNHGEIIVLLREWAIRWRAESNQSSWQYASIIKIEEIPSTRRVVSD